MPDVLQQCVLLNDKDGHDKVWAAMVVALPSPPHAQPMAQYVSIWGKRNGPYQHKWQPVETRGAACGRYASVSQAKIKLAGYRSIGLGASAGLAEYRAKVLACWFEHPQSKTAMPEEHDEKTCDFCIDSSAGDETNLCVCGHSRCTRHGVKAMPNHRCVETGCGCVSYVRAMPKSADESFCVACDAQKGQWSWVEREAARDAACARCGLWANEHEREHPHGYLPAACSGLVVPPEAIPQRLLPRLAKNLQEAQKAEEKARQDAWLPDLPCSSAACGHWLNSHLAPGEFGTGDRRRRCLVVTCSCEQWRYYCTECGVTSLMKWSHKPTCSIGAQHRKREKPEPIARTVHLRQPRRISHLLNDD